jgi:hypothetical protein
MSQDGECGGFMQRVTGISQQACMLSQYGGCGGFMQHVINISLLMLQHGGCGFMQCVSRHITVSMFAVAGWRMWTWGVMT